MNDLNIDLHCDLLYYLLNSDSKIDDEELRCSLPNLKDGNVKLQVMAIYAATAQNSTAEGIKQSEIFSKLLKNEEFFLFDTENYKNIENQDRVGILASIENASSFCEEDSNLDVGFKNLETIIKNTQKVLYIGITHHSENRFGGGNNSEAGLKADGKILIDYLADKKIAIDLAHTSDQLAYDILNYVDQKNYKTSILASHSNYRNVYKNNRNLPDELVKELIKREGLIGLNFIKDILIITIRKDFTSTFNMAWIVERKTVLLTVQIFSLTKTIPTNLVILFSLMNLKMQQNIVPLIKE